MTLELDTTALLILSAGGVGYVYAESISKMGLKRGIRFATVALLVCAILGTVYYKKIEQPRIAAAFERQILATFSEAKERYLGDGKPWPQAEPERRKAILPYLSIDGQPFPESEFDKRGELILKHPCVLILNDVGHQPQYVAKK